MRVLFIHNYYRYRGGEDLVVEEEQRLLQEKGHQVRIFSRDSRETAGYGLKDKLLFFPRTLYSPRVARDLRRVLGEFRPDVAVAYNVFPLLSPSVYRVLARHRVPVVQSVNNFRWLCLNGVFMDRQGTCERCRGGNFLPGIVKRCNRGSFPLSLLYAAVTLSLRVFAVPWIDRFVVSNEFVQKKYEEAGFDRAKLAVKPLSLGMRAAGRAEREAGSPGRYALFLGRLSREKGIFTLLRAMKLCPEVKLIMAGTGPEEAASAAFIRGHRLENVDFRGYVPEEEKEFLLKAAAFLVFPSECYENFPVTILEAYMSRVPVVGSDIGAAAALVEEGKSGLLFRTGDERDLALKIQMLWGSPDDRERLAAGAREKIEKEYSPEYNYRIMMDILNGAGRRPQQR